MDSLDWSRKFDILSISRLVLRDLGFSVEQIERLRDDDMQAIADTLQDNVLFAAGMDFNVEVKFVVRTMFFRQDTDNRTGGQDGN